MRKVTNDFLEEIVQQELELVVFEGGTLFLGLVKCFCIQLKLKTLNKTILRKRICARILGYICRVR